MNKDNAHKFIPLVQALGDGGVIQQFNTGHELWTDLDGDRVLFSDLRENYRIKPKPRTSALFFECGDKHSVSVIELTNEVIEALEKAGISYA